MLLVSGRLGAIVLAAGKGTRMRSALPKVLHPVSGKPVAQHVIDAARGLPGASIAVVVGHERLRVEEALVAPDVAFVHQPELLGTADAVARCRESMNGCEEIIVVNGDQPLTTTAMLDSVWAGRAGAPIAALTCILPETAKLGRVIRDSSGNIERMVEAADYEGDEVEGEINAGVYCFDAAWLWEHIASVPRSESGEQYLTRLPETAAQEGRPAVAVSCEPAEFLGVDDRRSLAEAERRMRNRVLDAAMDAGVTIRDPGTTYIDATVELAADVIVLPGSHLTGRTTIQEAAVIGPNTTLSNATVGAGSTIQRSVVEDSAIGARVRMGPFAHVRAGTTIGDDCEIGNYAEVKNSILGDRVKMHHFSYFGDADVGEDTNIAAGIITCNYDGVEKHRTVVGKRVLLGSDTMLVAPVTIGDDSMTAAGSVVLEDVGAGERVAGVPARVMRRQREGGAEN